MSKSTDTSKKNTVVEASVMETPVESAVESSESSAPSGTVTAQDVAPSMIPVPNTGGDVFVFANLQTGQSFKLADGSTLIINGMPVSRLKGVDGQTISGGKYGVTMVDENKWAEVEKTYGNMKIFKNGLVFAAPTMERGEAMARERGGLRHGYEPVNPLARGMKTTPKTED